MDSSIGFLHALASESLYITRTVDTSLEMN
jgi:hypothetical protein